MSLPSNPVPAAQQGPGPLPISDLRGPNWTLSGIGLVSWESKGVCLQISVVKTRMQSLTAKKEYRNALHCAYRIATEEGVFSFWKGTVPRLGRLIVSFFLPWRHCKAARSGVAHVTASMRCLVASGSGSLAASLNKDQY